MKRQGFRRRAAMVVLLFAATACDGAWEQQEIARFTSPDGKVDAVLVGGSAGATTSQMYELYIVPAGKEVPDDRKRAIFAADHVDSLSIRWREPRFLEVAYREARIHHFSNYLESFDVPGPPYVVEIRLAPLTNSWSLRPEDR